MIRLIIHLHAHKYSHSLPTNSIPHQNRFPAPSNRLTPPTSPHSSPLMRTNPSFPPIVDPQSIPKWQRMSPLPASGAGGRQPTTAIDSYPEYPKIKRTRTRGLPPPPGCVSASAVTQPGYWKRTAVSSWASGGDLVADRPGQMTDPQDTASTWSRCAVPAVTAGTSWVIKIKK